MKPQRSALLKIKLLGEEIDFSPLLESKLVQRMAAIRQLQLIHLCPPNEESWFAQHNRLDHSIGAMEITNLFLIALLKNSSWFRYRFKFTDGLFLLLSSVLHDLGHYPCAHSLEDTNIFPHHETITNAFIIGDIEELNLNHKIDKEELRKLNFNVVNTNTMSHDKWPSDQATTYPLRYCEPSDLHELHEKISLVLNGHSNIDDFVLWYKDLKNIDNKDRVESRLIFRVLSGILSGPIDSDKMHYLANDGIHCGMSLTAPFEGKDFLKLLDKIRVPIKQLDGSPTQRYCLGVQEGSGHLPQLLMFLRAAMYAEVYWSRSSRLNTALLRFIVLEAIRILFKYEQTMPKSEFILNTLGEWGAW